MKNYFYYNFILNFYLFYSLEFSSSIIDIINPSEGIPHHWFGSSVYISDNIAIIGASGDGDYTKYGNAYIYKEKNNKWIEIAKLQPNNPNLDDGFGTSVSIYLGYAFVGAYRDDTNGEDSGCVYYFTEENGWLQEQKIVASDGAILDYFGSSLAQYKRQTLVVGAWGVDYGDYTSCGAAYFYRFSDNVWILDKKVFAHDVHSYQWFGISVTVYQTKAAIGAWGDNEDGSVAGAVYTYDYIHQTWNEIQKLTTGIESNHMGYAIHMYEDVLGIGMPNSYRTTQGTANNPNAFRTGMVVVYRLLDYNHWEFEQYLECNECNDLMGFGSIISVSKENILIGMHGSISLWKYNAYETSGYRWNEDMVLTTNNDAYDSEYFYGSAVSIRNNVILIGIKTADMIIKNSKKVKTSIEESGVVVFYTAPSNNNNNNNNNQQQQSIQVVDDNMTLYVILYIIISVGILILLIGPLAFFMYYMYSEEYNDIKQNNVKKVELKPLVKNHQNSSSSSSSSIPSTSSSSLFTSRR